MQDGIKPSEEERSDSLIKGSVRDGGKVQRGCADNIQITPIVYGSSETAEPYKSQ